MKLEKVDITLPIILTGGFGAHIVKAVLDDLGFHQTQIFVDPQEITVNVLSSGYKFKDADFAKKNAAILTMGFGAFGKEMSQ